MRSRVLAPMGIGNSELVWRSNAYRPKTLSVGGSAVERREFGSGISTSVDVMAKFGLMLLRDGVSIPAIARTLYVSPSTAKTYVSRLYEKLGASNRAQALMAALRNGLI